MCGRFSLFETADYLKQAYQFEFEDQIHPRYNIAPGQDILTVIMNGNNRRGKMMKWGLVPFWAKDEKIGYKMINARAETIDDKASFKSAFQQRRCLILADGFYEWKRENNHKQPYRFSLSNKKPFALAGLWEKWSQNGKSITSCTIITTTPNELTKTVHDRMPVILPDDKIDEWLNAPAGSAEEMKRLLVPFDAEAMERNPVSTDINSAKNEGPELIVPLNSL